MKILCLLSILQHTQSSHMSLHLKTFACCWKNFFFFAMSLENCMFALYIFLEWKNISQSTSGSLQCNLWDYLGFSECNKVTKMWTHFRHIHFAHNHNPHPSHPAKPQHKVWKLILQKVMYGQYCRCLEKGLSNRFILSREFARGRKHNFIAFLFAHISHESETTTTRGFCYLTQSAAVFT